VAQRSIEIVIGRLLTDEVFRFAFCRDAGKTLAEFMESGHELTAVEIAALYATPAHMWKGIATYIDPRLQKVSLRVQPKEKS